MTQIDASSFVFFPSDPSLERAYLVPSVSGLIGRRKLHILCVDEDVLDPSSLFSVMTLDLFVEKFALETEVGLYPIALVSM